MKKRYVKKRRSTPRRRTYKRRSTQNRMQRAAYSVVNKKYTFVTPLKVGVGKDNVGFTISHVGGKNSTNPGNTITLTNADPDTMLTKDSTAYQFFRITGVAFKLFFPEGTTPQATPVQWSMAYSANNVLNPDLAPAPLQTLATFQTSGCSARTPVKRYFRTRTTLRRLGIDWCNTDQLPQFSGTTAAGIVPLYGDQLPINQGSSTAIRVYRAGTATELASEIGRIQVTYYVQYKGMRGATTLT